MLTHQLVAAEQDFEKCWNNEKYTQVELADVHVNQLIASHYVTNKPARMTRTQLWDMEKKKALDPGQYIPFALQEGSAKSWNRSIDPDRGDEVFVRHAQQKHWLDSSTYGEVREKVYVNEEAQLVTFIGSVTLPGLQDEIAPKQPIFHVQHGVSGEEDNPINKWRIVFLTQEKDAKILEHFKKMELQQTVTLPRYIEIYLEKDLGVQLTKRANNSSSSFFKSAEPASAAASALSYNRPPTP